MGPRILVVDDDPYLLQILVTVLTDAGYDVHQAQDGLMALEAIGDAPPDLVLSDVRMPRLDGLALAETLAARAVTIPVILMSSAHNAPDGHRTPFLAKPFDLDHLLLVITQTLADAPE